MLLSVLDQSPVPSGSTAGEALRNSIDLAVLAERLGYHRYWVAEHHATTALAGSSPEILIGQIAAATSTMRVGSGGVMLSHYSALKVAENFRVLHALFPDRIDLGLGRAPGGDQLTALALRPEHELPGEHEFLPAGRHRGIPLEGGIRGRPSVRPHQGHARCCPVGPRCGCRHSTNFSAAYAAHLGLPFCFAHFINPAEGEAIAALYRANTSQPNDAHPEPRLAVAVTVVCADDDEEAERQASSMRLWRLRLMTTGRPGSIPTIEEALAHTYPPAEFVDLLARQQNRAIVGGPAVVRTRIEELVEAFGADEAVLVTITHDHQARRRSYELVAKEFDLSASVG